MGKEGMWVKLPKGAQVTMSRTEYEATQRLGFLSKIGICALIFGVFWLLGHGVDDSSDKTPTPQTTVSTPAEVKGT